MATKKQRNRRAKTFRHEYALVEVDDDGNEVKLAASELRKQKQQEKPKKGKGGRGGRAAAARNARAMRPVQPPTWNRAFKRGGLWGGVLFFASVFLFKGSEASRLITGGIYWVLFIPVMYMLDRSQYRTYLKRSGQAPKK